MSRLRANQITNENANGAPNFPHGLTVTGVVTATTSATTMSQIVVGSAVTANSQGIDVTGIVTATTVKVGSAISITDGGVAATRFYGSGENLTAVPAGFASMQVFTSSGTYTKPSGIKKIKVTATGGGASGSGGAGNTNDFGGGGGAGGTAIEVLDASSINTETVTIGAGGAGVSGAANGNAGGTTSFGSLLSATGGSVGRHGNLGRCRGGYGGTGSGGDINLTGGSGGGGDDGGGVHISAGTGGSSFWGGAGLGAAYEHEGTQAQRNGYHGGGGGGANNNTVSGSGGTGIVVVEEFK